MDIPAMNSVANTKRQLDIGHTTVYRLIGQGLLDARKCGGKTLVTGESIRRYVESLPRADIGDNQRAQPVECA